jgi:hypothetical protein
MGITNSFKTAISNGDICGLRIMMKNSLLFDPTFAEFDEMVCFAQGINGLFDTHDGREFKSKESDWDEDYMDREMVRVVDNFSHERISHLKDVVRKLRPVTMRPPNPSVPPNGRDSSYRREKRIAKGAVVGAVVGGGVGIGVASTAIAGALVGAAIGGIVGGIAVAIFTN